MFFFYLLSIFPVRRGVSDLGCRLLGQQELLQLIIYIFHITSAALPPETRSAFSKSLTLVCVVWRREKRALSSRVRRLGVSAGCGQNRVFTGFSRELFSPCPEPPLELSSRRWQTERRRDMNAHEGLKIYIYICCINTESSCFIKSELFCLFQREVSSRCTTSRVFCYKEAHPRSDFTPSILMPNLWILVHLILVLVGLFPSLGVRNVPERGYILILH